MLRSRIHLRFAWKISFCKHINYVTLSTINVSNAMKVSGTIFRWKYAGSGYWLIRVCRSGQPIHIQVDIHIRKYDAGISR